MLMLKSSTLGGSNKIAERWQLLRNARLFSFASFSRLVLLSLVLCQICSVSAQLLSVMSDSSQPHGLQPTRLLCPWVSPGKTAGVGCHFSPPENLPNLGTKPASLVSPVLAGRFFTTSATWEARVRYNCRQTKIELCTT